MTACSGQVPWYDEAEVGPVTFSQDLFIAPSHVDFPSSMKVRALCEAALRQECLAGRSLEQHVKYAMHSTLYQPIDPVGEVERDCLRQRQVLEEYAKFFEAVDKDLKLAE